MVADLLPEVESWLLSAYVCSPAAACSVFAHLHNKRHPLSQVSLQRSYQCLNAHQTKFHVCDNKVLTYLQTYFTYATIKSHALTSACVHTIYLVMLYHPDRAQNVSILAAAFVHQPWVPSPCRMTGWHNASVLPWNCGTPDTDQNLKPKQSVL